MTSFNRYLCAGALTVTTAFFSVVAPAQAAAVRTVSTAGIDLASPDGRAELAAKVARAAKAVCAPDDIRDLKAGQQARRCVEAALANSELQIAAITTRSQSAAVAPTLPH